MNFKVISFDLQGTLSDTAFSDEFWLELLPLLYSKSKGIPLGIAKKELMQNFKEWGKYDHRYYSLKYWAGELKLAMAFKDITKAMKSKPFFFLEMEKLISELAGKAKLIIISSTTREFIDAELAGKRAYFEKVFSSLDDFGIPGKPKELYTQVAEALGTAPCNILHIGDSMEMDIENAAKAGFGTFYFNKSVPRKKLVVDLRKLIFD